MNEHQEQDIKDKRKNQPRLTRTALARKILRARHSTQLILAESIDSTGREAWLHRALIITIMASISATVFATNQTFANSYGALFAIVEILATLIFACEYAARIWSAPDEPSHAHLSAWRARLAYLRSGLGIIDGLAVLPWLYSLAIGGELKILVLLRMVRFFKFARYSPGMRTLIAVLATKQRALIASAIMLLGFVLASAAAIYVAESDVQPDKFGSVPDAMWWAIVTLTTVGYGDVVPLTALGKMIGGVTMIFGLIMIALPIGIVATSFADEIHRQEFVVSWGMIARVPIFSTLKAEEIATIARRLRAQTQPAHSIIVRKGDPAHSMFFIASGEVEVLLPNHQNIKLGAGQFFGEMAIIRKSARSATVRAVRETKLLVLDAADLDDLMDNMPKLAQNIHETAESRTMKSEAPQPPEKPNA